MNDRRVRQLTVRAPARTSARRFVTELEDALRTASLGDRPDEVWVVRHLDLGRVRAGESRQAIARRLERQIAGLARLRVDFRAPEAAAAPVVVCPGPLDARVELAARAAAGQDTSAWFWPRLVAGHVASAPLATTVHHIVASLLAERTPAARRAVMQVVVALVRARRLALLTDTLTLADALALLQTWGWQMHGSSPPPLAADTLVPLERELVRSPEVHAQLQSWGAADPRTAWLLGITAALARPALATQPNLPTLAVASWRQRTVERSPTPIAERPPQGHPHAPEPASPTPEAAPGVRAQPVTGSATAPEPGTAATTRTPAPREALATSSPGQEVVHDDPFVWPARSTPVGGLLFLIPVLHRLGLEAWMRATPRAFEWDVGHRVLRRVLAGRTDAHDPHWAALRLPEPPDDWDPTAGFDFAVPRTWATLHDSPVHPAVADDGTALRVTGEDWVLERGGRGRAGARCVPGTALEQVVESWSRAVTRWLDGVELPLEAVVDRQATISVTRHRVTVTFPLDAADVRVRSLALDIDPGWVPWLGRVVHFIYA